MCRGSWSSKILIVSQLYKCIDYWNIPHILTDTRTFQLSLNKLFWTFTFLDRSWANKKILSIFWDSRSSCWLIILAEISDVAFASLVKLLPANNAAMIKRKWNETPTVFKKKEMIEKESGRRISFKIPKAPKIFSSYEKNRENGLKKGQL